MNTKLIALAIGFASIAAHAAGTDETPALGTISAHASSKLVVACSNETMPSYARVSDLLGTNNASVLYAASSRTLSGCPQRTGGRNVNDVCRYTDG